MDNVIIIQSLTRLTNEQYEAYRNEFKKQMEEGLILLPFSFKYVVNEDCEVEVKNGK